MNNELSLHEFTTHCIRSIGRREERKTKQHTIYKYKKNTMKQNEISTNINTKLPFEIQNCRFSRAIFQI